MEILFWGLWLREHLKKKKARIGKFESLYYWQLPLYIIWTLHATGHLFRVFLFTLLLGTRSWNPGHSCLDIHVKILITLWYLYLHICLCLYLWASFLFFLCPFYHPFSPQASSHLFLVIYLQFTVAILLVFHVSATAQCHRDILNNP